VVASPAAVHVPTQRVHVTSVGLTFDEGVPYDARYAIAGQGLRCFEARSREKSKVESAVALRLPFEFARKRARGRQASYECAEDKRIRAVRGLGRTRVDHQRELPVSAGHETANPRSAGLLQGHCSGRTQRGPW
jgi:hypothetical protein